MQTGNVKVDACAYVLPRCYPDLPLFWKSHRASCSLACVILYHVTGWCKRPIQFLMELQINQFWIERFSFDCRKVIGFASTMLHDRAFFHPIRSMTKTNRDSFAVVFLRFATATCNYFEFWLVHCIVCVLCDWLEWLLWFWFQDTQLKTALLIGRSTMKSVNEYEPVVLNTFSATLV